MSNVKINCANLLLADLDSEERTLVNNVNSMRPNQITLGLNDMVEELCALYLDEEEAEPEEHFDTEEYDEDED